MKFIKLLLGFMLILTMLSTGFSTQIFLADSNNVFDTLPNNLWTDLIFTKEISTLEDSSTQQLTGRIVLDDAQEVLHTIQVLNSLGNNTKTFLVSANSFDSGLVLNSETFNLTPDAQQSIGVLSSYDGEEVEISVRCTIGCEVNSSNGYFVYMQVLDDQEKTITNAMDIFLTGVSSLITFNLLIWKIVLYVFIIVIILGFMGMLFGVAFMLFNYIRKINDSKGGVMSSTSGDNSEYKRSNRED